jgi:predicted GTPase
MVAAVWEGAKDADLIALVIDAAKGINRGIEDIVMRLKDRREAKILVLNKVDIAKKDELLALAAAMNQRIDFTDIFMVSATTGDGIADLKAALAARVPEGPWLFPEDQVSDATDRMLAARSRASSSSCGCMRSSLMRAQSRPRNMRSARTVRSPSTSRSWSGGRRKRQSCSARAAR